MASPLCTWLVAACISATYDKDHSRRISMFSSSKRPRKVMSYYTNAGVSDYKSRMFSSFYCSGVQNLISCFAFEHCKECSYFKGYLSSYLTSFVDNGLSSLFGSKVPPTGRNMFTGLTSSHSGSLTLYMHFFSSIIHALISLIKLASFDCMD